MPKYFLNRDGVPTGRMAGLPGHGHIEIAHEILGERLVPGGDVYERMFLLGFVRVKETDDEVLVDAPRKLTRGQKQFLLEKSACGKTVTLNTAEFIAARG